MASDAHPSARFKAQVVYCGHIGEVVDVVKNGQLGERTFCHIFCEIRTATLMQQQWSAVDR